MRKRSIEIYETEKVKGFCGFCLVSWTCGEFTAFVKLMNLRSVDGVAFVTYSYR